VNCHRQNPLHCVVWWWVHGDTVSVCCADRRPEGRTFVRRMETSLVDPDPVGLRQWLELDIGELPAADADSRGTALRRHVRETLEQEGLTREFFEGFRSALDRLTEELSDGPTDDRLRHDVALATLLRLVFLYFLQHREVLDRDRRFVVRHLREARADGRNFYDSVLRPLFFGALNCSPADRSGGARELGELPFLNGGLFEPLPVEREHPNLTWPNEVWKEVVEDLLERYHFTADEGAEEDECRAVDPEMLGKVFEGLMYGESRHRSGSFYTPRDVVRRLVLDALEAHLTDETALSEEVARNLLHGDAPEEIDTNQREAVVERLRDTTILDPAVGTGAFLLESLRRLANCYDALEATPPGCPPDADPFERRTHIVHRHLFGVDVQRTAVRICELRLWLALFAADSTEPGAIDDLPALPNLSHRIGCGNSLLSPRDLVDLAVDTDVPASAWAPGLDWGTRQRYRDRVRRTQSEFLRAHGPEKADLRSRIEELEDEFQRKCLEARLDHLEERVDPLDRLADSTDLFGGDRTLSDDQQARREELREAIETVRETLEDIQAERSRSAAFDYAARFGPAVDDEGFDIVVTNPPWVRANRLEPSERQLLKSRYRSYSNDLWPRAEELGIRVPFGTQTDLAALFVERSLELLRPGGRFAGLLPAKVYRSLHGAGVRELIGTHDVESIEDFSNADRQIFDATVYPSVLHLKKGRDEQSEPRDRTRSSRTSSTQIERVDHERPVEMSVWSGRDRGSWEVTRDELFALGDHPAEPWIFAPPHVSRLLSEMRDESTALGSVEALQPSRGIMTGCNEVFLHSEEEARNLLDDDLEAWSRPVVEGRDVREGNVSSDRRLLWPYEAPDRPCEDLPEALHRHFDEHREELEGRADHRDSGPLWQLFRLKPGLDAPKVVWRDLGPQLEAAVVGAESVPLNTVYFIAASDQRRARTLTALFNSEPIRAAAYALGERARGGWRRHFCWVVRMLPVPDSLARWFDDGDFDLPEPGPARRFVLAAENATATSPPASVSASIFGLDASALDAMRDWRTASPDEEAA
ncbi:MAG: Eco57I restriction-modification methylase domain-containing protein, partial [Bradymonadaceae bacterium]